VLLTLSRDGKVSEFFLTLDFGARIHVPPPRPNDIVHVVFDASKPIITIYDADRVTGRMTISRKRAIMAQSAYSTSGLKLEI